MLGLKDGRREAGPRGVPGISPRRDEVEDFLPSAGELERFKLTLLELLRNEFGGKPGDEGMRCNSEGLRGDLRPGDCGSGVFAAVLSERRFREWDRRLASLFVDGRADLGEPLPGAGAGCGWFCMSAVYSRAMRARVSSVGSPDDSGGELNSDQKEKAMVERFMMMQVVPSLGWAGQPNQDWDKRAKPPESAMHRAAVETGSAATGPPRRVHAYYYCTSSCSQVELRQMYHHTTPLCKDRRIIYWLNFAASSFAQKVDTNTP